MDMEEYHRKQFTSMENLDDVKSFKDEKKHYVFVYGSLLRGFGNHKRHLGDAEYVGMDVTAQRYRMVSLGSFPMVFKRSSIEGINRSPANRVRSHSLFRPIAGEVYKVSDRELRALDALEGNGHFYTREQVEMMYHNKPCWMYLGGNDASYFDYIETLQNDQSHYCWRTEQKRKKRHVS